MTQWHRHLGVYGIYTDKQHLLVVEKTRGPYKHRYDMPGGSFDPNESIEACLIRELQEEIGADFEIERQVGIYDYLVPWSNDQATHVHHLAIFFLVQVKGQLAFKQVLADDTAGYRLVAMDQLSLDNASPLVMDCLSYLEEGCLPNGLRRFNDWQVKTYDD